jgi:hypothetical protein
MAGKEETIAAALQTKEGKDKLRDAIFIGLIKIAQKPDRYQILAQAALDAFTKKKHNWNMPL